MTNEEAIAIEHEIMRILVVTEEHKERVFTAHKMAMEALEIADRLEQADAQAHYLDRMRQTTKRAGYADGYIQAVKDIRGDTE